ncbi:WGR domain-containing protein (plasmid) [Microvirga terrae]|uniref:WGR domain-containing protein n=1 Tax=Microvirga terrae TaxID=2740529 RepID=A0ABY5RYZ7_9HYPH|nr:WGR domain-containing protein [Microvirga terrae]UVF22488.1 WGR domain-containing protein [Microvirga terrae]
MAHDTIHCLVLHRCDPSCNMARYYVLSIETSLFGDASLIREWGRIGRPGQTRIELYETQSMAVEALETWLQRKRRRGYALRDG